MKKYKLLKELPWLEAGVIIEYVWPRTQYSNDNVRINRWMKEWIDIDWDNLNSSQKYSYRLLENMIENLDYDWWLEKIKEKHKSIYTLKEWDTYYFLSDLIVCLWDISDCNFKIDLKIWNVFLTKEEAQKELEKRKSLAKIKYFIWENEIELSKDFNWYTIYWEVEEVVVWENLNCRNEFWIIFYNKEDAERCLKECKNEWNILFNLN